MARSTASAVFVALLLLFCTIATNAFAQDEPDLDTEADAMVATENSVEAAIPDPAPGVYTVVHFPNNPGKSLQAGEKTEILVGVSNNGDAQLSVHSVKATLHLPYDHKYLVQDFPSVDFGESTVPKSVQASFPYSFTINKYLQPGLFDLVATILYEVDGQPHQSVFYNGTVEVVETSGFLSGETLFLVTLGLGMLGLAGMWLLDRFQKLSKKTRKSRKVETGTGGNSEAVNDEWLQGTAFTQKLSRSISQPSKSKKKK